MTRQKTQVKKKTPNNIVAVAKLAGVSPMTVSRYFNDPSLLAPQTYKRVKGAVETLHYVPNAAALTLLKGRSETLAIILLDITNPFMTALARGAEDAAQVGGYTLFIGNSDERAAKQDGYIEALVRRRVDGVVLVPTLEPARALDLLKRQAIPVVLLDRGLPETPVDTVRGDSYRGARQLTRHLLDQGHTNLVFVGGPEGVPSLEDRLRGYRESMRDAGHEPQVHLGEYSLASGYALTWQLRETGWYAPGVIIAANNVVATGVLQALSEARLWPERGISVASFDPIDPSLAPFFKPFIAVAAQNPYEMGRLATKMLIERIEGYDGPPREVVLPVELSVQAAQAGES